MHSYSQNKYFICSQLWGILDFSSKVHVSWRLIASTYATHKFKEKKRVVYSQTKYNTAYFDIFLFKEFVWTIFLTMT
jgi:hypothetical protein